MEVSALKQNALPGLRGPSPLLRLQSDERLIALVRRGQHAAFETLVSRYQSRLLAFCRHMLGSKEDAEDVLQEVFTAAFNAILADERAIHVRPWLYRIARNRSLNHLRRASAIGVDSMDVHFAEGGISTGEKVLRRESFRQLIADVQELPETQRTALLLREIDALSYEQIAEAMETTIPSVKSLLVRARISLAEAAEARKLSCAEVREQLGEAAEGLTKLEAPARRHMRSCERCRSFRKQLKTNNVALAMTMPVGAIAIFRRLLSSKLGAGASASHVAGAGGAGASAAAGGTGATAGGFVTAGAGALASKAVAGLAAAAIVTAGAVEAEHANNHARHSRRPVAASSANAREGAPPAVVAATPQRSSTTRVAGAVSVNKSRQSSKGKHASVAKKATSTTTTSSTSSTEDSESVVEATQPPQVTEVVTESTQLPSPSTQASQPPVPVESGPTTVTEEVVTTVTTPPPVTETGEQLAPPAETPPAEAPSSSEAEEVVEAEREPGAPNTVVPPVVDEATSGVAETP
ncbi:MAG TPA: sigma-70 family RNA polymerase sigma factor [Solirubrobacteraceae bacterium]|jgi:RNA polymerase sigma factor (sigma-70 family)